MSDFLRRRKTNRSFRNSFRSLFRKSKRYFVDANGDEMTGDLDMQNNKIINAYVEPEIINCNYISDNSYTIKYSKPFKFIHLTFELGEDYWNDNKTLLISKDFIYNRTNQNQYKYRINKFILINSKPYSMYCSIYISNFTRNNSFDIRLNALQFYENSVEFRTLGNEIILDNNRRLNSTYKLVQIILF